MQKFADVPAGSLPYGAQRRLEIVRALATNPKVLLLDEPTTYLDICHQLEIMQLIGRLNQELGLTVVMVVHDLNHAIMYADHVVVVKAGKLVTSGAPREIITADLLAEVFKVKADEFVLSNDLRALVPVDLYK